MDVFTRNDLKTLVADHPSPCVSVFMPAHRGGAEADLIRWRKHLHEAEERLVADGWRPVEVREVLARGQDLLQDVSFWKNPCDGLAGCGRQA
jgi:hypothetical protein